MFIHHLQYAFSHGGARQQQHVGRHCSASLGLQLIPTGHPMHDLAKDLLDFGQFQTCLQLVFQVDFLIARACTAPGTCACFEARASGFR